MAKINGKPFIKLIDFGFARSQDEEKNDNVAGTAEYLAPEILKKEPHDHRIDLYSLGILLYRLIYKKFPFQSQDQLEIYKEHIENDFNFPEARFSGELINVVKKLLNKNPEERYFTTIQILYDLNIPISRELYQDWVPTKVFSNRTDILNIVNRYVSTASSGEIIVIRGFERAGKTAVSQEIYAQHENVIQLSNDRTKTGFELVKFFLNKLIFCEFIFDKLTPDTLALAEKILSNNSENLNSDLKLVVNKVTSLGPFILLLDDFNLYDSFALEVFKEIFPVFQVNGCYVILTEKSDLDYVTGFINNSILLDLTSFTTVQIDELLHKTYADFFPLNEVRQLIMQYADFLPGNVIEFLRNLVLLGIIRFEYDGIKVISDESTEKTLVNVYEEIYNIRYKSLTDDEIKISLTLSSFEITPDSKILVQLTGYSGDIFAKVVQDLQRKHILQSQLQAGMNFSSDGIKNFIYSQIPNKKKHHEKIARTIHQHFPQFSKVELARHYQICEKYDDSYSLLMREAEEANKIAAFNYEQNVLEQLIKLPLRKDQKFKVKYRLCSLYSILNIYKSSYELAEEMLKEKLSDDETSELLLIKGNSLIKLGEVEKGKDILNELLPSIKEEARKLKLMLDIAWAELETNNYDVAAEIGYNVIKNSHAIPEYRGDSYNLLGLIDFQQNDDLQSAVLKFEKCLEEYSSANLVHRVAGIEINIGNICNILGDYDNVEKHWNKSLEISSSLGNLNYQGQILMNFGIYHFKKQNFETSINNYKRANLIFQTLGDKISQGRSEINLGEVYLFTCEYQKAIDSLKSAREIFHTLQNFLEESESDFLLGKVYSTIGDHSNFNKVIEELNRIFETSKLSERIKTHIDFLVCIGAHDLNAEIKVKNLLDVANNYYSQEEHLNYFEAITLLIEHYLSQSNSQKAMELLTEKKFTEIYNSNRYLEIERYYLIGKIAPNNSTLFPENAAFYFK